MTRIARQQRKAALLLTLLISCVGASGGRAQPLALPPPKEYKIQLRYRIYAARDVRMALFKKMTDYLRSIGFHIDPGPEDEAENPTITRMSGTMAVGSARDRARLVDRLMGDPHIKSVLLIPAAYQVPANPQVRVKVQLELASGLPLARQRLLADQVVGKLVQLGFREAVGYDNRGHTRLVGTIGAGDLETLLKDLRWQPSGWLVPAVPLSRLPSPLKNTAPILATEVMPEPARVRPAQELAAPALPGQGQQYLLKIAPGLRDLAAQEGLAQPVRIEVILNYTPADGDRPLRRALALAAPGMILEGRMGPVLTLFGSPKQAAALAQLPFVSLVRLPRPAWLALKPPGAPTGNSLQALRASGLQRLHALGWRGQHVHVAVIDGDFRGYERFTKTKRLPAQTHYIDLTTERNASLEPDDFPSQATAIGHGTQCALALALAAPAVDLTLIRIDPAAPYQILEAARLIEGEPFRSESIDQRQAQLRAERQELEERLQKLLKERKVVLDKFTDTSERERLEKKPENQLTPAERKLLQDIRRYDAYFKNQAAFERDDRAYQQRVGRYLRLVHDLKGLKGIQVVSSSLAWNDGYPLGGSSPLSRYFDGHSLPFLWFQAAGDAGGQTWAGLFRDADGNGVMEFGPVDPQHLRDWWRAELNFLAWKPWAEQQLAELPKGARLRLSIQWSEVHDPRFFQEGMDVYGRPLADLRLVVLRQRDQTGRELPKDDFEVVARSEGLPQRLDNKPASATYEQTVAFIAGFAGRYAVRVEGRIPTGTWPASTPSVAAVQSEWDLRARLLVDAVDDRSRRAGRPVFGDYATDVGGIGMPGDARGLVTVGAADFGGKAELYSSSGPPFNLALLVKPEVLAYDRLMLGLARAAQAYGTSLSAPFAAGWAATRLSVGTSPGQLLRDIRLHPGHALTVP